MNTKGMNMTANILVQMAAIPKEKIELGDDSIKGR